MIGIIDTHCHLDASVFDDDREQVVARARASGLSGLVIIGHDPERWHAVIDLATRLGVRHTIGVHPNLAQQWSDDLVPALREAATRTGAVAIGETGLDFFRDAADGDLQRAAFVAQITLARDLDLPLVIHQREAFGEVCDLLRTHGPARGVFHCFTGTSEEARIAIDLGFALGIGGVLTFPRSSELRTTVGEVPREALLLETDSPYLAPRSRRGKRNEPGCASEVADVLAGALGIARNDVIALTTRNAERVFGTTLAFDTTLGAT